MVAAVGQFSTTKSFCISSSRKLYCCFFGVSLVDLEECLIAVKRKPQEFLECYLKINVSFVSFVLCYAELLM